VAAVSLSQLKGNAYYGSYTYRLQTSPSGAYTVTGLGSGVYVMQVTPVTNVLYARQYFASGDDQFGAQRITVTAGVNTPDVNLALPRGGRIAGRILDSTGHAIRDTFASFYITSTSGLKYHAGSSVDATGMFTSPAMPAGNYLVEFDSYSGSNVLDVGEWYSNSVNSATAKPVPVVASGVVTGIDAQLDRGGQITGTLRFGGTGGCGSAGGFAYAEIYPASGSGQPSERIRTFFAQSNGAWRTSGLRTGDYKIKFVYQQNLISRGEAENAAMASSFRWYPAKSDFVSADTVRVDAGVIVPNIGDTLPEPGGGTRRVFLPATMR
jgi:hypothetical protein